MWDGVICGKWDWRIAPRGHVVVDEFRELLSLCQNVEIKIGMDKIIWSGDSSGEYLVRGLKSLLLEK